MRVLHLSRPLQLSFVLTGLATLAVGCGSSGGTVGDCDAGVDAASGDAGVDAASGDRDGGGEPRDAATDASGPTCGPDRAPPTSMTRAMRCIRNQPDVDCTDFAAVFGFPPTTSIRYFQIPRDTYVALAFAPDMPFPDARFNLNAEMQQTMDVPSGNLIWSISTCPGDFNRDAVIAAMGDPDCFKSGPFARAGFDVGGLDFAGGGNARCGLSLAPGTTYYLNITYSDDDPATTPGSDLTWACGDFVIDPGFPIDENICGHQFQATSVRGW